jgi:hypothetical protein
MNNRMGEMDKKMDKRMGETDNKIGEIDKKMDKMMDELRNLLKNN